MLADWQGKLLLTLTIGLFLILGVAVYSYRSVLILAIAALSVAVSVLVIRQVSAAAKSEEQARGEMVNRLLAEQRLRMESELAREREAAEAKFRGLLESDIRARKRAEESLLSARLLQIQDEERRRLARELHDSAGQLLAALSMNLIPLEAHFGRNPAGAVHAIRDSIDLVDQLSRELRTISHLLHPPLLDEVGLPSGLRLYLEGFTERSKIKVDFDCPDDFGRFSRDLETAIFRVVQECLTNIHRHSGSSVAKVHLTRFGKMIRLEVADRGKGIPAEKRKAMDAGATFGVGISGMRERIRQLGGSLEIHSSSRGTVVVAQLAATSLPATAVA